MNIIETLQKTFEHDGTLYTLELHVTAWNRLCIGYRDAFKKDGTYTREFICSVCVEPENEPRKIEDGVGYLNGRVGNAKTLDDAAQMLKEYVENVLKIKI